MRCCDVDAIIDTHRGAALAPAERAEIDAHLEQCARCAAAWFVNEALAREPITAPLPGAFATLARGVRARAALEPARTAWPRHLIAAFASLLIVAMLFAMATRRATEPSLVPALVEGRDYYALPVDARAAPRVSRVEVVELFAYDCMRCYFFEPQLDDRLDRRGATLDVVRIPVQWSARATEHARAFYAAETLGKADEVQRALYDRIQAADEPLDTVEALASFFAGFGIDRAALERAFGSPDVERKMQAAREFADAYAVDSVPTVVVGGELVTNADMAGSPERLVEIVERLVECVEHPPPRHC